MVQKVSTESQGIAMPLSPFELYHDPLSPFHIEALSTDTSRGPALDVSGLLWYQPTNHAVQFIAALCPEV